MTIDKKIFEVDVPCEEGESARGSKEVWVVADTMASAIAAFAAVYGDEPTNIKEKRMYSTRLICA